METVKNKKEFLEKYKQLCLKYDCYIEGCGCGSFIYSIKQEWEDRNEYSDEAISMNEVINSIFDGLGEWLHEDTE